MISRRAEINRRASGLGAADIAANQARSLSKIDKVSPNKPTPITGGINAMNKSGQKVNSDSTFLIDKSAYRGDPFHATGTLQTKTQIGFKENLLSPNFLVKEDKNEDATTPNLEQVNRNPKFSAQNSNTPHDVTAADQYDAIDQIAS